MESLITIVLGAALGALSGLITARLQLPIQVKQALSLKLFEKRTESYVSLYEILSEFLKILDYGNLIKGEISPNKTDLINFLAKLEIWDSRNAIFLTPHSTHVCAKLRGELHILAQYNDDDITKELRKNRRLWSDSIRQLETSIKYDLGIYTIEPFPGIGGFNPVKDFTEADQVVKQIREGAEGE
jgi:hypothetical protein